MAAKFQYHRGKKLSLHRLPFVGPDKNHGPSLDFWNLPTAGSYQDGCDLGQIVAMMLLKEMRGGEVNNWTLGWMMRDYLGKAAKPELQDLPPEQNAISGQLVGFLSVISLWLQASVDHMGASLDRAQEKDLMKAANRIIQKTGKF